MFVSSKKAEIEKGLSFKQGRDSYISSLLLWHEKLAAEQTRIESEYRSDSFSSFNINVWDDYEEGKATYVYVEENNLPDSVCFDVLSHLYSFAKYSKEIVSTGVTLGFRFFDSSEVHPTLIGAAEGEHSLFKRWEMTIDGADYETLELIVKLLQSVPTLDGKALHIYSES